MKMLYRDGNLVTDAGVEMGALPENEWLEIVVKGGAKAPFPAVILSPGADLAPLVPYFGGLPLIKLDFPKYTDGRAFSMARQLRALGYEGDLRASGNVLYDQLQLMVRCGFDSFEIDHPATLVLLKSGRRPDVEFFYQPGLGAETQVGTRPWARRKTG